MNTHTHIDIPIHTHTIVPGTEDLEVSNPCLASSGEQTIADVDDALGGLCGPFPTQSSVALCAAHQHWIAH